MVASSTNISPNLLKYYVFATISFFVAVSFHTRVYHRFDIFESNMKEASRIKMTMEWDELKALNNYMQSVRLHRRGIHDTIEAYEYATAAIFLNETVQKEEKDVKHLRDEANQLEEQAKFDERMSTVDGMGSFQNNRASVGSRVAGFNLAKQAEEENERSELLFNQTLIDEALGKEKLVEAQKALLKAEMAQNSTGLDKGICYWASKICSTVRSNNGGTNSSYPAQPSNDVIKANRDIQNALKMIHKAEEEKSLAIELHRNASLHANMSTALLADTVAFRNESKNSLNLADEYREKAQEEETEAKKDEQLAAKEEADIVLKEAEIQDDNERSKYMFRKVGADRYQEAHAIQRMNKDLEYVEERKAEWEHKVEEAKHHVARAGWEALMASVSGLCLLVLVVTQIIATFRYQQPLRWILRGPPFLSQDLWYLICHVSIFVLAMGYVGELLMNFDNQSNMSRVGIVIIFALIAASLQILFLHLLQTLNEFPPTTQVDSSTIQILLKKLVIQKGTILALVSAIELLLCWCWMGNTVFTQVHKLNNDLMWFVVLCETAGYMSVLRATEESNAYASPNYSSVPGVSSQLPNSINDERDSLLGPSISGSSLGDVRGAKSPNASYGSPPSMHSVPFGDSNHSSTSSMGFSWRRDLIKVRLLFEFWLASLGLWIVRRDLELIRKLSPLSAGLVWGMVPLWILNICLFLVVATLIVSLANVKQGHL